MTPQRLAATIAAELERRGFMGWFVANSQSPLWSERTPEQEIGRVAAIAAAPLLDDLAQLRQRIDAALAEHSSYVEEFSGERCSEDNQPWPCATVRALTNGLQQKVTLSPEYPRQDSTTLGTASGTGYGVGARIARDYGTEVSG